MLGTRVDVGARGGLLDRDRHILAANGAFQGEAGEALVFEVLPTKIFAFAKGNFAQTRYRFSAL